MTCNHTPVFQIKMLFTRKPQFVCKKCGASLIMDPKTRAISLRNNIFFIVGLIYFLLGNGSIEIKLSILGGIILLYEITQFLLITFGLFKELQPMKKTPDTADKAD